MDGYVFWYLRFQARANVPVPGGPSARGRRTVREELFVQVFFVFFASSCFASFGSVESVVFVWRKLAGQSAWDCRTVRATRTVRYLRCTTRGSVSIFRLSTREPRTVRPYHADRPPSHRGLSAWCLAELLSSLLLVFHFRFGIVWGLFLGLVGPL
jgi:hypothetical protein